MDLSLTVETREETGKGIARKLRADGKVPAVIYRAGEEATPVAFHPKDLLDIFRSTNNRNTVVELKLGDDTVPALVKDAQRHPVSRELLHVDFYALTDDSFVEVMVPVRGVGRPAGAALGGRVRLIRRVLKTRCPYRSIPEFHDIDVRPLQIGDMVKASEIPTAEGVQVLYENDFNVLTCYGKKQRGPGKN